jgi:hypothetical protein
MSHARICEADIDLKPCIPTALQGPGVTGDLSRYSALWHQVSDLPNERGI